MTISKNKKKKIVKKIKRLFFQALAGIILFLAILLIVFFYKKPSNIYFFPENPKQGDTVFIKVKGESSNITGNFIGNNFNEKLVFYKNGGLQEWIAFLGIDASQEPGDYKIYIAADKEIITKEIKVAMAEFSTATAFAAPDLKQKGYTKEKAVSNIIKNDNPAIKKVLSNFTDKPYFSGSFSFPLTKVEEKGFPFGEFIKFTKYKIQHLGVDLKAPDKTEIYSVNDGKVVATFDLLNYGKTVIIDHGLDIFSLYLHLEEFKVSSGQMVKRGQTIGLSGETGYATAPHLHFSMRVGNSRVNPIAFIEASQKINEQPILDKLNAALLNVIKLIK